MKTLIEALSEIDLTKLDLNLTKAEKKEIARAYEEEEKARKMNFVLRGKVRLKSAAGRQIRLRGSQP